MATNPETEKVLRKVKRTSQSEQTKHSVEIYDQRQQTVMNSKTKGGKRVAVSGAVKKLAERKPTKHAPVKTTERRDKSSEHVVQQQYRKTRTAKMEKETYKQGVKLIVEENIKATKVSSTNVTVNNAIKTTNKSLDNSSEISETLPKSIATTSKEITTTSTKLDVPTAKSGATSKTLDDSVKTLDRRPTRNSEIKRKLEHTSTGVENQSKELETTPTVCTSSPTIQFDDSHSKGSTSTKTVKRTSRLLSIEKSKTLQRVEQTFKTCKNFMDSSSKCAGPKKSKVVKELKKLMVEDNKGWNNIKLAKRTPKLPLKVSSNIQISQQVTSIGASISAPHADDKKTDSLTNVSKKVLSENTTNVVGTSPNAGKTQPSETIVKFPQHTLKHKTDVSPHRSKALKLSTKNEKRIVNFKNTPKKSIVSKHSILIRQRNNIQTKSAKLTLTNESVETKDTKLPPLPSKIKPDENLKVVKQHVYSARTSLDSPTKVPSHVVQQSSKIKQKLSKSLKKKRDQTLMNIKKNKKIITNRVNTRLNKEVVACVQETKLKSDPQMAHSRNREQSTQSKQTSKVLQDISKPNMTYEVRNLVVDDNLSWHSDILPPRCSKVQSTNRTKKVIPKRVRTKVHKPTHDKSVTIPTSSATTVPKVKRFIGFTNGHNGKCKVRSKKSYSKKNFLTFEKDRLLLNIQHTISSETVDSSKHDEQPTISNKVVKPLIADKNTHSTDSPDVYDFSVSENVFPEKDIPQKRSSVIVQKRPRGRPKKKVSSETPLTIPVKKSKKSNNQQKSQEMNVRLRGRPSKSVSECVEESVPNKKKQIKNTEAPTQKIDIPVDIDNECLETASEPCEKNVSSDVSSSHDIVTTMDTVDSEPKSNDIEGVISLAVYTDDEDESVIDISESVSDSSFANYEGVTENDIRNDYSTDDSVANTNLLGTVEDKEEDWVYDDMPNLENEKYVEDVSACDDFNKNSHPDVTVMDSGCDTYQIDKDGTADPDEVVGTSAIDIEFVDQFDGLVKSNCSYVYGSGSDATIENDSESSDASKIEGKSVESEFAETHVKEDSGTIESNVAKEDSSVIELDHENVSKTDDDTCAAEVMIDILDAIRVVNPMVILSQNEMQSDYVVDLNEDGANFKDVNVLNSNGAGGDTHVLEPDVVADTNVDDTSELESVDDHNDISGVETTDTENESEMQSNSVVDLTIDGACGTNVLKFNAAGGDHHVSKPTNGDDAITDSNVDDTNVLESIDTNSDIEDDYTEDANTNATDDISLILESATASDTESQESDDLVENISLSEHDDTVGSEELKESVLEIDDEDDSEERNELKENSDVISSQYTSDNNEEVVVDAKDDVPDAEESHELMPILSADGDFELWEEDVKENMPIIDAVPDLDTTEDELKNFKYPSEVGSEKSEEIEEMDQSGDNPELEFQVKSSITDSAISSEESDKQLYEDIPVLDSDIGSADTFKVVKSEDPSSDQNGSERKMAVPSENDSEKSKSDLEGEDDTVEPAEPHEKVKTEVATPVSVDNNKNDILDGQVEHEDVTIERIPAVAFTTIESDGNNYESIEVCQRIMDDILDAIIYMEDNRELFESEKVHLVLSTDSDDEDIDILNEIDVDTESDTDCDYPLGICESDSDSKLVICEDEEVQAVKEKEEKTDKDSSYSLDNESETLETYVVKESEISDILSLMIDDVVTNEVKNVVKSEMKFPSRWRKAKSITAVSETRTTLPLASSTPQLANRRRKRKLNKPSMFNPASDSTENELENYKHKATLKRKHKVEHKLFRKRRASAKMASKIFTESPIRPPIKMTLSKMSTTTTRSNRVSFEIVSTSLADDATAISPENIKKLHEQCKPCQVMLTDFVKQLNFKEMDMMDTSSDFSTFEDTAQSICESRPTVVDISTRTTPEKIPISQEVSSESSQSTQTKCVVKDSDIIMDEIPSLTDQKKVDQPESPKEGETLTPVTEADTTKILQEKQLAAIYLPIEPPALIIKEVTPQNVSQMTKVNSNKRPRKIAPKSPGTILLTDVTAAATSGHRKPKKRPNRSTMWRRINKLIKNPRRTNVSSRQLCIAPKPSPQLVSPPKTQLSPAKEPSAINVPHVSPVLLSPTAKPAQISPTPLSPKTKGSPMKLSPTKPSSAKTTPDRDSPDKMTSLEFSHFICCVCPYMAKDCLTMETHIFSHTELMPIVCGYCSCKYFSKLGYITHRSNTHHDQSESSVKNHDSYYEVMMKNHTKMSLTEYNLFLANNVATRSLDVSTTKTKEKRSPLSQALSFDRSVVAKLRQIKYVPSTTKSPQSTSSAQPTIADPSTTHGMAEPNQSNTHAVDYTGRYVCTYCMFSVDDHGQMVDHVGRLHPDDNIFSCFNCDKFTLNIESMENHNRILHTNIAPNYKRIPNFFDHEVLRSKQTLQPRNTDNIFDRISAENTELTGQLMRHYSKARDVMNFNEKYNKRGFEADSTTSTASLEQESAQTLETTSAEPIASTSQEDDVIQVVSSRRTESDTPSSLGSYDVDPSEHEDSDVAIPLNNDVILDDTPLIPDLSAYFDDRRNDACRHCGEIIRNIIELKSHIEVVHRIKCAFSCAYCDKFIHSHESFVFRHIIHTHPNNAASTGVKVVPHPGNLKRSASSTRVVTTPDDDVFAGESVSTSAKVLQAADEAVNQLIKDTDLSRFDAKREARSSQERLPKPPPLMGVVSRLQAISAAQALRRSQAGGPPPLIRAPDVSPNYTSDEHEQSPSPIVTTATKRLLKVPNVQTMARMKHTDPLTSSLRQGQTVPTNREPDSGILDLSTKPRRNTEDLSPDAFKIFNVSPERKTDQGKPANISSSSTPPMLIDEFKTSRVSMHSSGNPFVPKPLGYQPRKPIAHTLTTNSVQYQSYAHSKSSQQHSLNLQMNRFPGMSVGTQLSNIHNRSAPRIYHRPQPAQTLTTHVTMGKPQTHIAPSGQIPFTQPQPQRPKIKDSIEVLRQMSTSFSDARLKDAPIVKCPKCYFTTTTNETLKSHIISDHTRKFYCPYCPSPVPLSKYTVPQHIRSCHPNCMVMFVPMK